MTSTPTGEPAREQPPQGESPAASPGAQSPRPLRVQLLELEQRWSEVARHLLSRRWGDPGLEITHPQYYALHHVCEQRTITVAQIAEALRLHETAAGRVIDRLARAGLVQRRLMPEDRRTIVIEPTRRGREVLATIRKLRFDELSAMMQRLDPAEREDLIRLFGKMAGPGPAEEPTPAEATDSPGP